MAESLIYELCKNVGKMVVEQGCLLDGVPEEAKKLRNNLEKFEAVVKAAEQREMEADVKVWLRELKDVAYDIEDVLDDWRIVEQQMRDQFGTSSEHGNITDKPKGDQVCFKCIPTPSFCFKQTNFKQTESRHDIAHTIRAINSRLHEIHEGKMKFRFEKSYVTINDVLKRELTTSCAELFVLQSQGEHKDKLVNKLVQGDFKSSAADRIPIISIVGMGGIGKTTLAPLVFNDENVKGHFPDVIWVCVSNTFNALGVAKAIARGFRVQLPNDCEAQHVLTEIENSIKGRKFLIVLDDVWEDSEGKWGAILKCLAKGDTKGSLILMTTHNLDLSQKMGAVFALHVGSLSETDAWSLFSFYAFREEDSKIRETVEDIARKLVKKCDGMPRAIQVLGRHMCTKTTRSQWHDACTSKIWDISFREKVFDSLGLSYLVLRSEARRCLAFCSVFPKGTVMSKNELIHQWRAQGYLQEREAGKMEHFGEECFDSLVRRSFFQVTKANIHVSTMEIKFHNKNDTYVVMHDIIHDFAQYISSGEIAILDPSFRTPEGGQIYAKPRHLLLDETKSNCPYSSFDLKALRSLFLFECSINILKDLISNKSYIRALTIISSSRYGQIGDGNLEGIGKLVHLRLVRLSLSSLTVLPEEICSLPYLQTLDLEMCCELKSLPKEIGRLTCLRHLLIHNNRHMNSLPKGLGKLRSLQTLSYFPCSNVDRKDCSSLADLGDLNDLRGHFWLKNLNKVAQVNEATTAQLHMKKQIRQLTLEFGEGNLSLQSDVLEVLEPAKENIVFLEISGYRGRRCPRWITQLQYLKEIQLNGVDIDSLPELGTLLFLEKLCVCDAIEVKHVGAEFFGTCTREAEVFFPKLTSLEFINMPWWEHWESPKEILNTRIAIMPSLHCLTLRNCGLRSLPRFLEYAPLARLEAHCRLLPVTSTGDGYPRRWSIGNIVLPPCLKEINTSWVEFEKKAPANQLAEGSEEIDSRLYWHNYTVPEWITDHLKEITLSHATDECLPPFGKMASLEKLTIMFAVKVGNESLGISNNTNDEAIKGRAGGRELATCIFFPTLKKLHFAWMPGWKEWEDPAHNYSVPKWITDHVTYLRDITLSHATDECLPPFGIMACLEKLTIMFAVKVEKVGNEFLGISNSTNDEANKGRAEGGESATCILFPRLKKLHFAWMPLWKEWEGPAHQNNLIIMPSLCHLKINECKELNCLPQFLEVVDLKKLEVDAGPEGSMPKIQNSTTSYANNELSPRTDIREISLSHIRHGWVLDWSKYCVGLRELQLDNCDAASLAALEVFPSLEVLRICYCPEIRRLGKEVILISSLKELHLSYLRNLEEWEDPSPPQLETSSSSELTEISRHGNKNNSTVITCMPQFRILSILYCPKLKALPDFLRSIPLESLSIEDCWAIEAWCAIEAGEDWRNWTANIPQFNFTGGYLGNFPISTQNVEVPELNRDNYKVWKERILWKLSNRDLCFAIENPKLTITDDSTEEEIATHEQWVKANRMSCIYIKTKMSPSTRGSVDHHHDVNDLLKAIDEQFIDSDKALASKLIMEFLSMKLTTVKGVREHIMKMRDLAAKLKTLKEVDMSEAFLVHLTLNSLPEEYTSFKETYHTQRDKRSINELITMCVQEEERLLMDHVKECDDDYQG